ncbi:unnamed protein product [Orchesella dallaii]|uniref:Cytochrome P450 n=1 Tax=Orchesella dallaii TaxID=48710 RepID=A0ABP1Q7B0_9HEXA
MDTSTNIRSFVESHSLRGLLLVFFTTLFLVRVVQRLLTSILKEDSQTGSNEDDLYKAYKNLGGPRPFPLRLIGNGYLMIYKNDLLRMIVDMPRKYGACYKLTAFNEDIVVLNSPEAAQALMMSPSMGHVRRGRLMERIWPEEIESFILYPGGEKFKNTRKMLSYPFKHKALKEHNHCFHKHSETLTKQLATRFKGGDGVHIDILLDLLKKCTFRISSETLMGVDLDDTEGGEVFCENLDELMKIFALRAYRPWLLIPWIWRLSSEYRKMKEVCDKMEKVTLKVIEKYKEKTNLNQNDLSNTMIEVMFRNGVDEKLIFYEVAVMLGVANETTPLTVEQAMFFLSLHPNHQKLCHEEIDAVYNDPINWKTGVLEFEALKELKQLERCINETLRINPLSIIMRQLETPLRIDEKLVIPEGVSVVMPPYALHHQPQYYPDPEKYDPDRFLPEEVTKRHPFAFVPFSAGQRGCIGMKLAMIELKVMLATILRDFEVKTVDTKEDLKFVIDPTIKPSRPIRFMLKKREN